jgi:hypothetical protein
VEMPPPRFATQRDPSRPTRGTRQAEFARIWMRAPLMPAQRYIADVAGELLPSGLPAYPLVVVTEPRRAGKTHLALARKAERCFSVPGYRSWYTAQTGGDARDGFLALGEQINGSPLKQFCRVLVGNGREVARFANGSTIRPHPPSEKALHGKESDDNDVDEAWAFTEAEGQALMQAIGPTQLTRPGAQTWIWSAGGTAASTWLAELVARGRDGATPGLAYFEWSIPDDADPEDLEVIAANHPAVGHTVTMDSLRSLRTQFGDDSAGWARAAGNRWTEVIGGAISDRGWLGVRYEPEIPDGVPTAFAVARAADGSEVGIVAAAKVGHRIVCEVLEVLPTSFGAADLARWHAEGHALAVAQNGPSATIYRQLVQSRTRRLKALTVAEESAAVVHLLDGIDAGLIWFRPHPAFKAAQKVAGTRATGDGGKAWARVAAGASIATLEAAGQAAWTVAQIRPPASRTIR